MSDPNLWQPPLPSSSPPTPDVTQRIAQQISTNPSYQRILPPVQSVPTEQVKTRSPVLDKIIAGMSAFNKTFLQASPAARLASAVVPGAAQKVQESIANTEALRQQNPIPATIGKVGGFIGSGVQPSGLPPGGSLTSLPAIAANAAATMAPYSAVAALDTLRQTGDIGAAAQKALAAEALGVAGGTALGGAGLLFGKLAKAAHPVLNEIDAASYGITGRDISKPGMQFAQKMGLNPKGYEATHGETQLDKVMTLLREQGGRSKAGIADAAKWVTDQYDSVNQVFKESGATLAGKTSDILSSPIVQTMKGKFDPADVDNTIQTLVGEADRRIAAGPKGWTDARDFLNKQMQRGIQIGQKAEGGTLAEVTQKANMGEMLQDSASVVKAHMNELTGNVLNEARTLGKQVPDLESLDQIYSAYPSLRETLARRMGKPVASLAGGSETTAGLGAGALLGGLIGGPAGAAAAKVAGATALAPLIKRGIGAATNQVMGRSSQWIDSLLQKLSKMQTSNLSGATARMIGAGEDTGAGPGISGLISPSISTGQMLSPKAQAEAIPPGQVAPIPIPPAGAQSIPNAPLPQLTTPGPQGMPLGAQPIPLATPQLSPQEQAQVQFNQSAQPQPGPSAFSESQIQARIDEKYARYVQQFGSRISRQEYEQAFRKTTNNLDPMLPNTWKAMLDDPTTSDRIFKSYLNLQKIGHMHPESAFNYYKEWGLAKLQSHLPRISSEQQKQENQDHDKLVGALADMTSLPTKAIDDRFREIAFEGNEETRKKALMDMIIREGGVDVPLLQQMGLW